MRDEITTLLESFGYPVRLQGSFAPSEAYPDNFFTVWNNTSTDWSHYDNAPTGTVWDFTVYFYSNDPSNVITKTGAAIALLRQNGWIISGKGYDAAADDPNFTGRAFEAIFAEIDTSPIIRRT